MAISTLSAAAETDRGQHRADNEDAFLCELASTGGAGIFAVADGMGGQNAGEIASSITIDTLRAELLPLLEDAATDGASPSDGGEPLTERVRAAVARCNERILRHAQEHPEARGMGSTLTLAFIKGSLAIIGNIGDSRTYRVRNGAIETLTQDHSLVAHLAAIGEITADDVYSHPQRSYIYRALGGERDVEADIATARLQSGDTLLLCSDGLWEMVRDDSICRALSAAPSLAEAATSLVALANENGGADNISVVVVRAE